MSDDYAFVCLARFDGGYCGIDACVDDANCPSASACVIDDGGGTYCARLCEDKVDCNANRSSHNEASWIGSVTFVDANRGDKPASRRHWAFRRSGLVHRLISRAHAGIVEAMRALGLILIWTCACSVSPDLSELPCPCGPGFRCVADRCVVGDAHDAGTDVGSDDAPMDVSAADVMIDDGGADAPVDAPVDAGPPSFMIAEDGSTSTNIDWFGSEAELDSLPGIGIVESQVFDAGRDVHWTRFEWTPAGAYGRPFRQLPEPPYDGGNVGAQSLRLLLPFDAPIGSVEDLTYPDLSDAGRVGSVVGTGATSIEGVFDQAFAATEESWAAVPMSDNLFPGTDDHTLAFWARSRQSCLERNRVFVGADGSGIDRSHIWIGCMSQTSSCAGDIGGVWRADARVGGSLCTSQDANDGEWHHMAVRKVGSGDAATVGVWFDGVEISLTPADYTGMRFRFGADDDLWFGHFLSGGGYPTVVDLDEVLLFARALDDSEMEELHRRGRLNAHFEIRVCGTADCSDGVYTNLEGGPGGSGDEVRFDTLPIAYDTDFTGRYAQIRLTMSSTDPNVTPEIRGMRLLAE